MYGMVKPAGAPLELDLSKVSHFIVDWDETVTSLDTMHLLGAAAYECKPDFEPKWDYFVREFLNDYTQYSRSFQPSSSKASSQKEDNDAEVAASAVAAAASKEGISPELEEEIEFLLGLKPIEYESAKRVEDAKLFENIDPKFIQAQVGKVLFRDGWWDLIKKIHPAHGEEKDDTKEYPKIAIVSVNWSADLIRRVLDHYFPGNDIAIYSNDIDWVTGDIFPADYDSINYDVHPDHVNSATDPKISRGHVRTANDKKRIIAALKDEAKKLGKELWYFGDSSTDTLALLEADKGVVVGKKKTFDKLTKELKIPNLSFISDWNQIKLQSDESSSNL
ncbi:uncharacterized protein SAPINGB_P001178 [Magnusiomyces paraingens]|uniref:Uncharacterized protein n=1 Tax=Magnusiomyces paraingens TaxID=2606893 RepID=A0A5E8B671_9ASCO|nr:uncharacterized protein SAPINGB_P001178 [Saprochaete ingens]VVT46367.1 unnamed protein product [Saprochaete ingens]